MKKTFIAVACAFMVAFGMTSCEDLNLDGLVDDIKKDLDESMGSVNLAISNPQGESPYARLDSLNLSACVNGVVSDTVDFGEIEDYEGFDGVNTFILGANISLADSNIDLTNVYPIFGVKTCDTTAGVKNLNDPMKDTNILMNFDFGRLITEGSSENLFAIALSETSWYVGASGQFNIEKYPLPGLLMKANLRNVKAYYVTQADLDSVDILMNDIKAARPLIQQYSELLDMDEDAREAALAGMNEDERNAFEAAVEVIDKGRASYDTFMSISNNPGIMFPSITINGRLESRRTDVQGLIDQLNVEE